MSSSFNKIGSKTSFLLNIGINNDRVDQDGQFRPNYNIGKTIWSLPLDDGQDIPETPILISVDDAPMQYEGTNSRWVLVKDRRSQRNILPGNEDTRKNGLVSKSKRSSGSLHAVGSRFCKRLVPTGNYMTRAICKVAFGETVGVSNPASLKPRAAFIRTVRSNDHRSGRIVMPGDDARLNGYISARKRFTGTLNAFGDRLCQRLATTGNYISRAFCKMAFGNALMESNPVSTSGTIPMSKVLRQPRANHVRLT